MDELRELHFVIHDAHALVVGLDAGIELAHVGPAARRALGVVQHVVPDSARAARAALTERTTSLDGAQGSYNIYLFINLNNSQHNTRLDLISAKAKI